MRLVLQVEPVYVGSTDDRAAHSLSSSFGFLVVLAEHTTFLC